MWERLLLACHLPPTQVAILKILRVQQRTGSTRFDVFVTPPRLPLVMAAIANHAHRWHWHCRPHRPYRERHLRLPPRDKAAPDDPTSATSFVPRLVRLGTYNINGMRGKTTDVDHFLRSSRLDVLALQETLLTATSFGLNFRGYVCFSALGQNTASTRGVSLLLRDSLSAEIVGRSHTNWIFARLSSKSLPGPTIVGNVYLPTREARPLIHQLQRQMEDLRARFPDDPILVMGDFNADVAGLQRITRDWPGTFQVLANEGNLPTRRNNGRCVDHICYSPGRTPFPTPNVPQVLQTWDMSDHFPVVTQLPFTRAHAPSRDEPRPDPHSAPPPSSTWTRIRAPDRGTKPFITESSVWEDYLEAFADEDDEDDEPPPTETADLVPLSVPKTPTRPDPALVDPNDAAELLTATAHRVASEHKLHTRASKRGTPRAPAPVRRAINQRRKAWRALVHALEDPAVPPEEITALTATYDARRLRARALTSRHRRRLWEKRVAKAHANLIHKPKQFWNWASSVAKWNLKSATGGIQPMQAADGTIASTLPEILEVWRSHYGGLATDITGNSQCPDKWRAIAADESLPDLPGLDAAISRDDVWEALRSMRSHTAPGDDGIPTDFWKSCLVEATAMERASKNPDLPEPSCPMTDALLSPIAAAWEQGSVPVSWTGSIVISIPKKGDLTLPGNYRGISLMPTALKILCVIISDRLNVAAEAAGRFSPAQAGFRRKEEAITQAGCFIEIIQRRRLSSLGSYAVFVDLKKAYDMVPHEGLFAKLRRFGVRGKCYTFLKDLYRASTIRVRLGHGPAAQHTMPFPLHRGVRQGCPLSPILFNIYINDMFDECAASPVLVPQGNPREPDDDPIRVPGLLFADDLVGLAPTLDDTQVLCDHISGWCDENEMEVGIGKCGLMEFPASALDTRLADAPEPIQLQGQDVPLVKEYTYLGLQITPSLAIEDLTAPRLASGRKTVQSILPFLSCRALPLSDRWIVLQAVVLARLLYGAEVYGMRRHMTDAMQRQYSTALRGLLSAQRWKSLPSVPLWNELRSKPICALAAGRRARAYAKCLTLKTWVSRLAASPLKSRSHTWISGILRWMPRFCRPHSNSECWPNAWRCMEPHQLRTMVEESITKREQDLRTDPDRHRFRKEAQEYLEADYTEAPLVKARVPYDPKLNAGITWIVRFRVNAVATAEQMQQWKSLPLFLRDKCPCCSGPTIEDREHIVVSCPKWQPQRDRYIVPIMERYRASQPDPTMDPTNADWLVLLLGGGTPDFPAIDKYLPRRTEPYESDDENSDSDDDSSSPSEPLSDDDSTDSLVASVDSGYSPSDPCAAFQVASYLTSVMHLRQMHLNDIHGWPRQSTAVVLRAPGQRPGG